MLLIAFDDVAILQAYLLARSQTHVFLLGNLHEVVALDPQVSAEGDCVCAVSLVLGIVYCSHFLCLVFRIVGDNQLHGVQYGRDTGTAGIEVITDGSL